MDEELELTQEDCWTVVGAFFSEKGLVSQQLDSFDEFLMHNVQEIVGQTRPLEFRPKRQYTAEDEGVDEVRRVAAAAHKPRLQFALNRVAPFPVAWVADAARSPTSSASHSGRFTS